jgi:mRNA-degrading endonuclease YafQ of YafQ-DinJ toxin-antitoxin module
MRQLVQTPRFRRAVRKFVARNPRLQERIEATLRRMEQDVFSPDLGTHKLSGDLFGLRACSCGYDCRVLFSLEKDARTGDEVILLHGVGTHDEIY